MTTTQALPKWDLNDLYAGVEAPEIELDLKDAEARARAFQAAYQGRLVGLDGAGMAAANREGSRTRGKSNLARFAH